eukprot:CAMPEP_0113497962 /NCGR_PEP_ID=MMETSP0014_2-20120614/30898_1 /TAXON_ID=2857 /ORGANISM="Nitzschia sp." /LENGTH=39 /DNA_ID=CAMNT_0000391913 /DNA_START=431 /DNA_END=547 /DNA_ORIENTATION=- /assembly_acc=CAM_ASM_000159
MAPFVSSVPRCNDIYFDPTNSFSGTSLRAQSNDSAMTMA